MVKKKKAKKTKTAKEKIRDDVIAVLTIQLGDELIDKVKTGMKTSFQAILACRANSSIRRVPTSITTSPIVVQTHTSFGL